MTLSVHYHQASLIEAGNKLLDSVDTVSFDLFDTLLVRRVHNPDLVKLPVARYISQKAEAMGLNWSWQEVQKQRDFREKENRANTAKNFVDHEACYPDFMGKMLTDVFGDLFSGEIMDEVTKFEMQMENAMLVPRQELHDWLKQIRQQGKKILVVSDMYLPASHLRILLEHANILEYVDEVVSSADSFLAKASGKAYPMLAEKFELTTEKWLHVGDNAISDGFRAIESGLKSLLLQDSEEARRKAIAARYYFSSRTRPFWKGRALQQLMAPLEAENSQRSNLYVEGYNFLGPLICNFIYSVADQCQALGVTKIFFLSREGWMFKQVWENMMPYLGASENLPEIEYLYVSRLALAGASCAVQGLTPDNANIVFLPPGNRSFEDVCRVFALDAEPLKPYLEKHELSLDTTLTPRHEGFEQAYRVRFDELLRDTEFQEEIKRQTGPRNQALQRYLEDKDFFKQQNVALVDIGWLGTIQRFFFESIAHREDLPNCHGMLFGATRGIPYKTTSQNRISGLVYDRHKFDLASSAVLYAQDLFEEACRAPHPTLIGYELKDEGYDLKFRSMEDEIGQAEKEQDNHYADLQQGVIDASKRFGPAAAILCDHPQDFKAWTNYLLVSKLAFAKTREIKAIRHLHHLDDFHGSKTPKKARRPQFLVNPWQATGWRSWLVQLLPGRYFRKHLRQLINQ